MATAYLSLGSNLGDRAANLREALGRLDKGGAVRVTAVSSLYETAPVGETPEPVPAYLNLVARVETELPPEELLLHTQAVERAGGRAPTFRWGPRVIDIDIALYDAISVVTETLTIPHPRLRERAFVLRPLVEVAPGLRLPDGTTVKSLLGQPVVAAQEVRLWEEALGLPCQGHDPSS
jgi:2-amino-4-hydroxy-6-hydroxymethyldihydropteridine diphosphokinase